MSIDQLSARIDSLEARITKLETQTGLDTFPPAPADQAGYALRFDTPPADLLGTSGANPLVGEAE